MKTIETNGKHFKNYAKPWKTMESIEQWKPLKNNGKQLKDNGKPLKKWKTIEKQWETIGNGWNH